MSGKYEFEACIFDLDGVIVDTADFHFLSWKRLADELGFDFTKEQNEEMKGISRMDSLDVVLQIGGLTKTKEEKLELAYQKNEWYKEFLSEITKEVILPGVETFLALLTNEPIPFALGSASKNAGLVMSKIGISHLFEAIVDGNDTVKSKPDPEVFLLGASKLDKPASSIVVFEDSYKGLEAANTGGFISCGVGDETVLDNADFIIDNFEEMTIEKLNQLVTKVKR